MSRIIFQLPNDLGWHQFRTEYSKIDIETRDMTYFGQAWAVYKLKRRIDIGELPRGLTWNTIRTELKGRGLTVGVMAQIWEAYRRFYEVDIADLPVDLDWHTFRRTVPGQGRVQQGQLWAAYKREWKDWRPAVRRFPGDLTWNSFRSRLKGVVGPKGLTQARLSEYWRAYKEHHAAAVGPEERDVMN